MILETPPNGLLEHSVLAKVLLALRPFTLSCGRQNALRANLLDRVRAGAQHSQGAFFTVRAHEGIWAPLSPLVAMKMLHRGKSDKDNSYLLRMQPGGSLPAHHHPVYEECLVLEGEVCLGDVIVRAGDYHLASAGAPHGVIKTRTGALLFLHTGAMEDA